MSLQGYGLLSTNSFITMGKIKIKMLKSFKQHNMIKKFRIKLISINYHIIIDLDFYMNKIVGLDSVMSD